MKKLYIFLLGIIGIFFATCSEKNIVQDSIVKHREVGCDPMDADGNDDVYELSYEEIIPSEYVSEHIDLFGSDVLIFESESQAEEFIQMMADMDYENLRLLYTSLGYNNEILSSIIVCDSVFVNLAASYGIDVNDTIIDNDNYQSFLEEYESILESEFAEEIIDNVEEIEDEDGNISTENFVSPKGGFDLRILLNSRNICIIDKIVYKVIGDYVLTVPIHKYEYLEEVENELDIINLLDEPIMDEREHEVPYNVSYSPVRKLSNSSSSLYNQTSFTSMNSPSNVRSLMMIDYSAYDKWGWWYVTKRVGKVRIRNFVYNFNTGKWIATKSQTRARLHFYTTTSYQTPQYSIFAWFNSNEINKKIKDRTYSQTRSASGEHFYRNYPIDIYWSYVYANNSGGAQINYGVWQMNIH